MKYLIVTLCVLASNSPAVNLISCERDETMLGLPHFPTPGYFLFIVTNGFAAETHSRLYVADLRRSRQVRSPADLRKKARIDTSEHALAFCRMFTSADLLSLRIKGHGHPFEVLRSQDLPPVEKGRRYEMRTVSGEVEVFQAYSAQKFAVIKKELYDKLALETPTARYQADKKKLYYVVERNLVGKTKRGWDRLYRSYERVYPDGEYVHEVKKIYMEAPFIQEIFVPLAKM